MSDSNPSEAPSLLAAAQIAALALDQEDSTLRPLAAAALRDALSAGRSKVAPLAPPLVSRVVYRSHSLMSDEGHHELLAQCQRNNAVLNISGVLIHAHAEFMQVLEGPIGHLSVLAEKIYKDPRHRDFVLLKTEIDVPRLFGSWSMASMEIDPDYFRMLSEHLSRQDGDVTRTLREFVGQRASNACAWAA
ncbi:MAG: BLUF domain-containing protein [Betaproteobacteria bacterium]|jgi:Sensors of blue-light using FAD|nr:BLUF domain-containing protein [Betaproteobacteria bacterium]NBS46698.1 BLUF domain-containing protein [Betaproteobacteria bacterium]